MAEEGGGEVECPKCEECVPGLPGWMATFSDLVTLLLTFFVLLLSFAKTESAKYEAALGSIRNAFGGNVLRQGEVIQRGKSADNAPTMLESQQIIKPFPIEFLTMEGILDKHEINRESDEDLTLMKKDLADFELNENVDIFEEPEGIKVKVKDKIFFKLGSVEIDKASAEVLTKMVKLVKERGWSIFVEGHSSKGEASPGGLDAYQLSARRAEGATRFLIREGIQPQKISTVFYGDTRPNVISGQTEVQTQIMSRRVEFLIRKRDLNTPGHKVEAQ